MAHLFPGFRTRKLLLRYDAVKREFLQLDSKAASAKIDTAQRHERFLKNCSGDIVRLFAAVLRVDCPLPGTIDEDAVAALSRLKASLLAADFDCVRSFSGIEGFLGSEEESSVEAARVLKEQAKLILDSPGLAETLPSSTRDLSAGTNPDDGGDSEPGIVVETIAVVPTEAEVITEDLPQFNFMQPSVLETTVETKEQVAMSSSEAKTETVMVAASKSSSNIPQDPAIIACELDETQVSQPIAGAANQRKSRSYKSQHKQKEKQNKQKQQLQSQQKQQDMVSGTISNDEPAQQLKKQKQKPNVEANQPGIGNVSSLATDGISGQVIVSHEVRQATKCGSDGGTVGEVTKGPGRGRGGQTGGRGSSRGNSRASLSSGRVGGRGRGRGRGRQAPGQKE